jgi:signal peptidase I
MRPISDQADLSNPIESPAVTATPRKKWSWRRRALVLALVAVGVLAVLIGILAVAIEPFSIPSGSMESTVHVGDRVLVNRWSYHLHAVHRGDIVVFKKPTGAFGSATDRISRVIGLPGDRLSFANGHVYIDDRQLEEPYLDPGTETRPGTRHCTIQAPCAVPSGEVWVMGDKRAAAYDSRYFGPIPESSLVGRAFLRMSSIGDIGSL